MKPERNLQIGDLVLMVDPLTVRGAWRRAIITDTFPDQFDVVRKVKIAVANGSQYMRDVRKIVLLEGAK